MAVLALAACSSETEEVPEAPAPANVHEVMLDQIDANADMLWEYSNSAISDQGGLDPALLNDALWARIADLASKVEGGALTLAAMDPLVVARPGVAIADEDVEFGHSAAQVQAFLDAAPEDFQTFASALAVHAGSLAMAARNKDAIVAGPLIDQLDGVCEDCHLEFWYPEQRDLVNQYRAEAGDIPEE